MTEQGDLLEVSSRCLIYKLMPLASADIGAVAKEKRNAQQGYQYRGIDQALDALHPALVKHGLMLMPRFKPIRHNEVEAEDRDGFKRTVTRVCVELTLCVVASDGSALSFVTLGEAWDYNGDKATNKAMSTAMKYAIYLGFCVPLSEGELDDPDSDDKEGRRVERNGHSAAEKPTAPQKAAMLPATPSPKLPPEKPARMRAAQHSKIMALCRREAGKGPEAERLYALLAWHKAAGRDGEMGEDSVAPDPTEEGADKMIAALYAPATIKDLIERAKVPF